MLQLPSAAAGVQATQEECCCSRSSGLEVDDECSCRKDCWREQNDLSVSTRASSHSDQVSCLHTLQLESLESNSEAEDDTECESEEPRTRVPLRSSLFLDAGNGEEGDRTEASLLRAQYVQCVGEFGPVTGVVGGLPGEDSVDKTLSPKRLLVDCRVQAEDDPQLVSLIGARLRAGIVKALRIEPVEEAHSEPTGLRVVCLCKAPPLLDLGHPMRAVPMEQAVEELLDQQVQRNNARLVAYQREINSRMLGHQRRRLLGLAPV